ncbi:D-serine dehydratase transcriptional activator, partial [Salmonella enterica subsp. enterica serovar Adelaide str. A4-669]
DAPSAQLTHHFLMDEAILPVCSPDYARRFALQDNLNNLRHCTLLHDRQAWSNDSGTDEWHSWAQHFAVNLPDSSGIHPALASIVLRIHPALASIVLI